MILFRQVSFYLALAGAVSLALLVMQMRAGADDPVPPPPAPPPTKPFERGIGASGLVEATHENTQIGVPQAGLVAKVHVAVWDRVEAGAPLLQLDDREARAALASRGAEVAVREAALKRARDQLKRTEALRAKAVVAEEELEDRANAFALAEAELAAARAAAAQAETLLDRLTVRAPIPGTVLQVNLRAGEFATPGAAIVPLVLGDIDEVQVRADIDEQLAPRVRPGARAVGYLKGEQGRPIEMEFVRIEPFVVPKRSLTGASTERVDTRVLQVIYRVPNRDGRRPIYAGQQLDVFIEEP